MLVIKLDSIELYNEETNTFTDFQTSVVRLEHSLISVSKWESIWQKPFIMSRFKRNIEKRTVEENRSYLECMSIGPIDSLTIDVLMANKFKEIEDYINSPKTATIINRPEKQLGTAERIITSELVYAWMVMYSIPFDCEKWHLNRLLTLIDICNIFESQRANPKKGRMSRKEILMRNRELNKQRREAGNTTG